MDTVEIREALVGKLGPYPGQSVGVRLKTAIDLWGSLSSFSQAMSKAGVPGPSCHPIHSYISGQAKPTLAFVGVAAKILGVRPAWLAFDHVPMFGPDHSEPTVADRLRALADELEDVN